MKKKVSTIVLFAIISLFGCVSREEIHAYANESENIQEEQTKEGTIWYEEIETYFYPSSEKIYGTGKTVLGLRREGMDVMDVPLTRTSFTPYDFGRTVSIKGVYSGKEVVLFKHEIYGTVYLYVDGKVHLCSLGSSISDVHALYTAGVISNTIGNTDGTVSTGISEVDTFSKVFDAPKMYFTVTFKQGSAQATYDIMKE